MTCRGRFLGVLLLMTGCHSFTGGEPERDAQRGGELWVQGQAAMAAGKNEAAIGYYEESLAVDPKRVHNHMSLAAALLDKGQFDEACNHLSQYVALRPENTKARAYYAELLLRLHRTNEARIQWERFDLDAQDEPSPAMSNMIRCHSKLTQIARGEENEYAEHLHRGIGLYFLSRARADLPDPDGDLSTEGLLCKAASELGRARLYRPDEARPAWYLYEIWSQLGLRQPALRSLAVADHAAPFSYLTRAEKRGLQLACQREATKY